MPEQDPQHRQAEPSPEQTPATNPMEAKEELTDEELNQVAGGLVEMAC